ncbi:MAG: hypothetical protein KBC72_13875 [Acinetobacter sp.]|nr:hypothetical protein [Acinetobacter sp.]
MTNELGTTLQDIEAKAERKREAEMSLDKLMKSFCWHTGYTNDDRKIFEQTIRKYIEEN